MQVEASASRWIADKINSWFVFTLSEIVECKLEREAKLMWHLKSLSKN